MSKVIVHIDMNAFFVRCEEIKNPSLVGKSVAIGHDGRGGIVSTCSYKAREFGVRSGMPMFQAKQLCSNLIIIPPDFRFYRAMSATFISFVKRYTRIVEIASIDECFADFTDAIKNVKDAPAFFKKMQTDLFNETQLMCSIGVASNKFLAKMGSDYQKPMGLTIIRRKDIATMLYPLSIDKMFGIGKKTAPKLQNLGINTIGDLALMCNQEDKKVMDTLGKFFYVIKDWINGYGSDDVVVEAEDPKSIGHSTTLMHDTSSLDEIRKTFEDLSREVSLRAKRANKVGSTIQIVAKESEFNDDFKTHNKSITFETPTNDANTIFKKAFKLYSDYFTGMSVRLLGVTLQNLIDPKNKVVQMSLFEEMDNDLDNSEIATKMLISELNKKLSKPLLMRASEVRKK